MKIMIDTRFDDRDHRRALERISGWRLIAFLAVASFNFLLVAFFGTYLLAPDPKWQSILAAAVSAHSAVVAVALGSFRFHVTTKILVGTIHLLMCVSVICQFSTLPLFSAAFMKSFFTLGAQFMMLCGVATAMAYSGNTRLRIRIRDFFGITAAAGISMSFLQYALPQWHLIWKTDLPTLMACLQLALTNSLWCLALLSLVVRHLIPIQPYQGLRIPHWILPLALLGMAITFDLVSNFAIVGTSTTADRLVFAGWIGVSFLPVLGMSAEAGRKRWISPLNFYRQQQQFRGRQAV